ncbi:MAG: hypothetical protein ABIK28_20520 [Planctomycetota bacterium]
MGSDQPLGILKIEARGGEGFQDMKTLSELFSDEPGPDEHRCVGRGHGASRRLEGGHQIFHGQLGQVGQARVGVSLCLQVQMIRIGFAYTMLRN